MNDYTTKATPEQMDGWWWLFSGGSRISPRTGRQLPGGSQHMILPNFPKNCMKLKGFGPPGGRASLALPLDPPLLLYLMSHLSVGWWCVWNIIHWLMVKEEIHCNQVHWWLTFNNVLKCHNFPLYSNLTINRIAQPIERLPGLTHCETEAVQ